MQRVVVSELGSNNRDTAPKLGGGSRIREPVLRRTLQISGRNTLRESVSNSWLKNAMILLPVIERELRAAARQRLTYNLRLLGVLALLGVFLFYASLGKTGPGVGGELFTAFHGALFWAIWVLVPLATADCISRERREGTLPLLFLTPLKPREIVYAKFLANGLRAFTLWFAALPVLTICFIAGGVSWFEIGLSVLVNFSSICLTMAAGLAASSLSRSWTRALGLAATFAVLSFGAERWALEYLVVSTSFGRGVRFSTLFGTMDTFAGVGLTTGWEGAWQQLPSNWGLQQPSFMAIYLLVALCSLMLLLLVIRFSAWNVKRTWQEGPPSPVVAWLEQQLFQPVVFQNLLRRWLRWELQHNPIGWLERRSWNGRLVVWSWLAIVVCIYSSLLSNINLYQRPFHNVQSFLATLLAGSMALSAAGSFRRERETGVLELLLVSPLREWQIIAGRVRGLFGQFVPAIALLCCVWLYGATFLTPTTEVMAVALSLVTFVTVPLVGLYFSLARPNFIAALLWTVGVQIIAPAVLERASRSLFGPITAAMGGYPYQYGWYELVVPATWQVLVALIFGWQLFLNLKRRKFVLQERMN